MDSVIQSLNNWGLVISIIIKCLVCPHATAVIYSYLYYFFQETQTGVRIIKVCLSVLFLNGNFESKLWETMAFIWDL